MKNEKVVEENQKSAEVENENPSREKLIEAMHEAIYAWNAKDQATENVEEREAILLLTEHRQMGAGSQNDKATFVCQLFTELPPMLQMQVLAIVKDRMKRIPSFGMLAQLAELVEKMK